LLDRPSQFPETFTEKLMAYALGRRVEYYDRPAIRKIVREAATKDYKWSAIIQGIIDTPGFQMRSTSTQPAAPQQAANEPQKQSKEN
jgi:hypothetical protein